MSQSTLLWTFVWILLALWTVSNIGAFALIYVGNATRQPILATVVFSAILACLLSTILVLIVITGAA